VFAGTYLGFTTDLIGSTFENPLFVGAHCAGGAREAVVLTGVVEVRTPHVTLEGMRLDAGLTLTPSSAPVFPKVVPGDATLRELVLHAPLKCDGLLSDSQIHGLHLDGTEIYPAAGGSIGTAAELMYCPDALLERSAACGAFTADWHVKRASPNVTFKGVLGRDSAAGACFLVDEPWQYSVYRSDNVRLEKVVATGCEYGIRIHNDVDVDVIIDSQILSNNKGISISGFSSIDYMNDAVPHVDLIRNNLIAGNTAYGLIAGASSGNFEGSNLTISEASFNTFLNNGIGAVSLTGVWHIAHFDCGPTTFIDDFRGTSSSAASPACPSTAVSSAPRRTSISVMARTTTAPHFTRVFRASARMGSSTALTLDSGAADIGYHDIP
jgi:hypothetical protein